MKLDQQLLNQHHQQPIQQQQSKPKQNPYFLWEQHNVTLIKSQNFGYGIAISGGQCSNNQDTSIYISDIVPGGPAENKLIVDDIILSVNGVNVENVEHSFVIRLLKEAKDFIHLSIRRKTTSNKNPTNEFILSQNQSNEQIKRQNAAIQQTASTVISNYQNNYNQTQAPVSTATNQNQNLMSIMMSSTHSVSSLKPIKLQLSRKDKKDSFGIVLGCKYYIKDILPNSVGSTETNLKIGDILLKLNDLSPDQVSLIEANKILSKTKENKINLVIKRNSLSSIDSEDTEVSSPSPSQATEAPAKPADSIDSSTILKQSFKPNETQNVAKFFSNKNLVLNYRTVVFARENGIGIRLAGGNKVGIFICDVQYNSPAERAGLRISDKIIKVNNVDYMTLTREEAVQHILNVANVIEMIVANSPEEYESNAFDALGGDSFYVRAHFSLANKSVNDLEFRINDILHVTDTLYNGVIGQWVASKLDRLEQGGEDSRGTIPNQSTAEQLVQTAPTIEQLYSSAQDTQTESSSSSNGFSLGASARMSIRMKLAGKNSLAKRSKSASRTTNEIESNQNIKVSKANTFYSNKYPAYERVVLKEVNFTRPIVIFGPLADVAREKLKSEFPSKYEIPDSYSTDPNDPNSQASGVIKLASIKAIIEKNRHSLLDITPNAVDHLNYAQYFPICVYLKAQSRAHTKDLRQKYAKNLKSKSSKRLYDNSIKLQTYYSHLFTATIQLDSNQWFKKLKDIIDTQQKQPIWISQDLDKLIINQQVSQVQAVQEPVQSPSQFDMNLQQQLIDKQKQLLINANANQEQLATKGANKLLNNRYVFDDNFEFPIYTAANPALSMCGAASSTYSLYEENYNRCSFAASDTDICASVQNNQQKLTNFKNDPLVNPIYSTNFNNKSTTNGISPLRSETEIGLTRVKSDPSLAPNQNEAQLKNYNQINQGNFSQQNQVYTVVNGSDHYQNHNQQTPVNNNLNQNWKKYATYSANSIRNLENSSTTEQIIQQQQIASSHFKSASNSSSPIKSVASTPVKNRPSLNDSNFVNYQLEKHVNDQFRRLSTTSDYTSNNEIGNQQHQQNGMRNSASYSSYKLIKNSQSSLIPSANKSINEKHITSPIKNENFDQSNGSLLRPICVAKTNNNSDQLDNSIVRNNGNINALNKHQLFKQELANKLNDKLNLEQNQIESRTPMTNSINNNTGMKSNPTSDIATLRRKKDIQSPSRPPPPVLPKPKFILPQTTTTNLVLQRNLKSKSELNIATPSTLSSSSAACSSSSSSSSSSSNENEMNNFEQKQQQQQLQQQHQQPLRNKLLENNSLISTSQGYQSDTWESHSSRQSFEIDAQFTHAQFIKNLIKPSKQINESKLAKTTILASNMIINAEVNNLSDGSMNGMVSGSDDTDSIPNDNQSNFYNQKNLSSQKPTSSGSSTVSTTSTSSNNSTKSNSSSSSGSGVALSASTTLSSNNSQFVPNLNDLSEGKSFKNMNDAIELPIFYQPPNNLANNTKAGNSSNNSFYFNHQQQNANNNIKYPDLYSNDSVNQRTTTYTAHYNDNGLYRMLALDSNSNCSIIASANGIFDSNGGVLESADTGVSINVPEGAIANGCSFDLYFKVCHCKTNITNGKGELLRNPIVMCGPRGIRFLKPIELQIPHFISIDGQSWSYAFKTNENNTDDEPYNWNSNRFNKKTLINSVTIQLESL